MVTTKNIVCIVGVIILFFRTPSGHYCLDMKKPQHLEALKNLMAIDITEVNLPVCSRFLVTGNSTYDFITIERVPRELGCVGHFPKGKRLQFPQ